jgi:hypothetical protein
MEAISLHPLLKILAFGKVFGKAKKPAFAKAG